MIFFPGWVVIEHGLAKKGTKNMKYIKEGLTGIIGIAIGHIGGLFVLLLFLTFFCLMDYVTGLMASYKQGRKIKSELSIEGIIKKTGIIITPIIMAVADLFIVAETQELGIPYPLKFAISSVTAVWLVFNELISITENLINMGVSIPGFIEQLFVKMQSEIDKEN